MSAHRTPFTSFVAIVVLLVWSAVGVAAWFVFVRDILSDIPAAAALRRISDMARPTTLFDDNDQPVFTIYRERRMEVPLSAVSPYLTKAVLAIEDQRFYDHGGIDVVRVIGAAVRNLRERRAVEGASTLTQQLARQSFFTREKTFRRKLKEMLVAERLEKEFSKDEILQLYLNKVYFGDGLYGIEAASLGYFGTHAADLDLSEAALLAGLVKSPSAYAPTVNLDRAIARRNVVLQTMREAGSIDAAAYEQALQSRVHLQDTLPDEEPSGQYFKEEVRKQLVQRFGWERVYEGGLKVYTTLDLNAQQAAETQVARSLAEIEQKQARGKRNQPNADSEPLQAALVALDPQTGEIRAMVGGRDFDRSHFNRATQARRQPGSAFKPFVFAAAIERGYTAASLITNLNQPIPTIEGDWVPADGHGDASSMTMRAALRASSNRAAVQLLQEVGIPTAVQYVQRLGFATVPSVPSLALGSGEVTLLSMASAYGSFDNGGMLAPPTLVRRVEDSEGHMLYTSSRRSERALSEATAFIMTTMMADVVNGGTAWQARRVGFTLPAAGKTGTTNDYHDAWFVGFTPHLVAGVWIGYDQPRTIIVNGYAGDLAVPLWARFMKVATQNDKPDAFRPPDTVRAVSICRMSGRRATDGCREVDTIDEDGNLTRRSMVYTEYFVRGTEPLDLCPLHRWDSYDAAATATTATLSTPALPRPRTAPAAAATAVHPSTAAPVAAAATPAAVTPVVTPVGTTGVQPMPAPPAKTTSQPTQTSGFWWRLFHRNSGRR